MRTEVIIEKEVKLKNPILIVGLTGIGNVGRTAVSYLIDHLNAEKFGEVYSCHFPHITIVNDDGEMEVLKNELFFFRGKRDVIFLTGNTQSITPEGHYELVYCVLEKMKEMDVREIITIGGLGSGEIIDKPRVFGIPSHKELGKIYEKYGVEFEHNIGEVIGASGLFIGIGKRLGFKGICLLGETPGFLLSDPKATEEVLKILEKVLEIKIDYENLNIKIKELEKIIKKIQELQGEVVKGEARKGKELTYIG